MSLRSVIMDVGLLAALADNAVVLEDITDASLRDHGLEDYGAAPDCDAFGMLSLINGGDFCLGNHCEGRVWIREGGSVVVVDLRKAVFFTALGGPTEWIEVDWQGHVSAFSTEGGEEERRHVLTSEALRDVAFEAAAPFGALDFEVPLLEVVT